jgi:hypothetical protein
VNVNERDEISASVAAHAELGSRYDTAVAEGLVERIGEEIDRRIDSRLGGGPQPPRRAPQVPFPLPPLAPEPASLAQPAGHGHVHHGNGVTGLFLGLGSMGLGVGATAVVSSNIGSAAAQVITILLIWAAIVIINVAHSQRR